MTLEWLARSILNGPFSWKKPSSDEQPGPPFSHNTCRQEQLRTLASGHHGPPNALAQKGGGGRTSGASAGGTFSASTSQ